MVNCSFLLFSVNPQCNTSSPSAGFFGRCCVLSPASRVSFDLDVERQVFFYMNYH